MPKILRADDINKNKSVLWTLANKPTQDIYKLRSIDILNNLKLLYLLSDEKILVSASCFYESPITVEITRKLKELFENGDIVYFIDNDFNNVVEHGLNKQKKSPSSLSTYQKEDEIIQKGEEIDSLGILFKRSNISISGKIVDYWINDIQSNEAGSIGFT